ncbi:OmpA family protein [Altererythrobacter sp. ZODW24]|uniref:OmpA family protein n=1 Tax=Altererythrobacter sp. ZODW24 TaxID=2185142 RepID=UPI000DF79DD4|nr:OmpA family protein [Altererythrobacter sp. ZODW24]
MRVRPSFAIGVGALLTAIVAIVGGGAADDELAAELAANAQLAIVEAGGDGVTATFSSLNGWPSRHAVLSGAEDMGDTKRTNIAQAVSRVPGVGGVFWADGTMIAERGEREVAPLHCQDDIEAILGTRTIRFEESSANMDPRSYELLDEVAKALRPCLGAIIGINGHTDSSGDEERNITLSRQRAQAVRRALIDMQLPADGLRARGLGSSEPVEGLDTTDPANRRIEFSVIATVPLVPTPVDTPGAR